VLDKKTRFNQSPSALRVFLLLSKESGCALHDALHGLFPSVPFDGVLVGAVDGNPNTLDKFLELILFFAMNECVVVREEVRHLFDDLLTGVLGQGLNRNVVVCNALLPQKVKVFLVFEDCRLVL
jgi:hypothetical protein